MNLTITILALTMSTISIMLWIAIFLSGFGEEKKIRLRMEMFSIVILLVMDLTDTMIMSFADRQVKLTPEIRAAKMQKWETLRLQLSSLYDMGIMKDSSAPVGPGTEPDIWNF
jgi:hypothetical protein